ncbi:MAG: GtrA family protein [Acholeplasmatales bacterium]|nr:GtrA family protein [Acholeplasmatales bacterium]
MEDNKKKELFWEIIRFLIVGGISTLVDYAVFYTCNKLIFRSIDGNLNLFFSTALGFISGFFVNWFLQRFVFKNVTKEQQKDKVVFFKFTVVSLIGLGITELGMFLAKGTFDVFNMTIFGVTFDFWKLFFKVLMTVITLIWNYLARKFYVFKKKKENDVEEV